jgi:hypothetical protein
VLKLEWFGEIEDEEVHGDEIGEGELIGEFGIAIFIDKSKTFLLFDCFDSFDLFRKWQLL